MGHDGVTSNQWPRPFSREDRPTPLIHLTPNCHDHELACGLSRRGRSFTESYLETTCPLCLRVALLLVTKELVHRSEPL